jgi:hypothetical protein
MRKIIVIAGIAALGAAPAALAKERNISMIGAPMAPMAGQAWTATIAVKMDGRYTIGKAPAVRIVSRVGTVLTVLSMPTRRAGVYRARLTFPSAGTWRVLVVDRETGRSYEFRRMSVRAT